MRGQYHGTRSTHFMIIICFIKREGKSVQSSSVSEATGDVIIEGMRLHTHLSRNSPMGCVEADGKHPVLCLISSMIEAGFITFCVDTHSRGVYLSSLRCLNPSQWLRFQAPKTMFWDKTPCSLDIHRYFGGIYCLHLQNQRVKQPSKKQSTSTQTVYVPPKRR